MDLDALRVPVDKLTCRCDPDSLGFETTEELSPLEGTVGQDRAIAALDFGLNVEAPGYNIYVVGYPGTGRTTTLLGFLNRVASEHPTPDDWCYLHNFRDPLQPLAVRVPPGIGRQLVQDMEELIRDCLRNIPGAFESEEYRTKVEEAMRGVQTQRESITQSIDEEAQRQGFTVQPSPTGILTTPIINGQPISREVYNALSEEVKAALRVKSEALQEFINKRLIELRRVEREVFRLRAQVDRDLVRSVTAPAFMELKEKYKDIPAVLAHMDDVREDIAEHVDEFRVHEEQRQQQEQTQDEAAAVRDIPEAERFTRYRVNVLVDNGRTEGAPVIFEYNPSYYNLFGRVEYRPRYGTAATDLTMVRPGAIHLANGGYLALQAKDILANPLAWGTLKHVLRTGEARIENFAEQNSSIPTATLRPEPIPISAKIVLMGTPQLFALLQRADEDFRKFFKVKADFDLSMEKTPENIRFYACFVCNRRRDFNIKPFHKGAVAKLVEYASRLVEDQERLTTRFIDIADLITEADYWARHDGSSRLVMAEHIAKAIQQKTYRSNLPEERIQDFTDDGAIMIDTAGAVVGQVNGLSVLMLGDYTFGRPVRITARTSLGRGQVANLDREAQMTGRVHNKGFFILTSYLMGKYGQDRPLNVRSSIGFEQTYDEVEGDSASAAELYALLSSLSVMPIKQGIAVTGSVNQFGQVQAIGGAIYKVEGFYDVCKAKGLTGQQGVVIPMTNVKNLILRDDVVQAVKEGRFHVWAVDTIEQGMELLTGVPMGQPNDAGSYPEGTINHAIIKNLDRLAERARELFHRDDGEDGQPAAANSPATANDHEVSS
ncbi:MAG: AAA family ATPase [Chloroflexi bacterium]|nr:AAA family ATPase [Chloroflexota bacterium]